MKKTFIFKLTVITLFFGITLFYKLSLIGILSKTFQKLWVLEKKIELQEISITTVCSVNASAIA